MIADRQNYSNTTVVHVGLILYERRETSALFLPRDDAIRDCSGPRLQHARQHIAIPSDDVKHKPGEEKMRQASAFVTWTRLRRTAHGAQPLSIVRAPSCFAPALGRRSAQALEKFAWCVPWGNEFATRVM